METTSHVTMSNAVSNNSCCLEMPTRDWQTHRQVLLLAVIQLCLSAHHEPLQVHHICILACYLHPQASASVSRQSRCMTLYWQTKRMLTTTRFYKYQEQSSHITALLAEQHADLLQILVRHDQAAETSSKASGRSGR